MEGNGVGSDSGGSGGGSIGKGGNCREEMRVGEGREGGGRGVG